MKNLNSVLSGPKFGLAFSISPTRKRDSDVNRVTLRRPVPLERARRCRQRFSKSADVAKRHVETGVTVVFRRFRARPISGAHAGTLPRAPRFRPGTGLRSRRTEHNDSYRRGCFAGLRAQRLEYD